MSLNAKRITLARGVKNQEPMTDRQLLDFLHELLSTGTGTTVVSRADNLQPQEITEPKKGWVKVK